MELLLKGCLEEVVITMGKFSDAFDDETAKTKTAAQAEQDKRDVVKAKLKEAFRPLQEKIIPVLDAAAADLDSKGIKTDRAPKLSGLHDDGRYHLMFQLVDPSASTQSSVYRFSLSPDGTLLANRCDPVLSYRNSDVNILNAKIGVVTEAEIEGVMMAAIRELAQKSK